MSASASTLPIPVLLLKTRSQSHDAYEEYFSTPSGDGDTRSSFIPYFVPVLAHRPNTENLGKLEHLLRSRTLKEQYGGMIFTSQRAVEGWVEVVKRVDQDTTSQGARSKIATLGTDKELLSTPMTSHGSSTLNSIPQDPGPFPIYTVGPATSRALTTLASESSTSNSDSTFTALTATIHGAHTGSGALLASYIFTHYNLLHSHRLFTYYEAPRLPFIPLLGPERGTRIDRSDPRLRKKPLLFLVGETRRDVIPKTLMDVEAEERIEVEEMEVYGTDIMEDFEGDFRRRVKECEDAGAGLIVVTVFSPQGCGAMLRSLGFVDDKAQLTERARRRWNGEEGEARYVIAAIGPTTRDHLMDTFGFEADVCARKPSPEGVGVCVRAFLKQKGLV